jgi:hypothetical protein
VLLLHFIAAVADPTAEHVRAAAKHQPHTSPDSHNTDNVSFPFFLPTPLDQNFRLTFTLFGNTFYIQCVFCSTGRDAANKYLQADLKRKDTLISPLGMPLPFDVANMQLIKKDQNFRLTFTLSGDTFYILVGNVFFVQPAETQLTSTFRQI